MIHCRLSRIVRRRTKRVCWVLLLCIPAMFLWSALGGRQRTRPRLHLTMESDLGVLTVLAQRLGLAEKPGKELGRLADIVQARLQVLQNPRFCESGRLVACSQYQACGFGCQLHHVAFCLLVAYATNRTLVWQGQGSPYTISSWWGQELLPVSRSCPSHLSLTLIGRPWSPSKEVEQARVIRVDHEVFMNPKPSYVIPALPADLAPQLLRLHSRPSVWWLGQLLAFLLRPSPSLLQREQQLRRSLHFSSPVVGVHVRRGDKIISEEAKLHELEEYMAHVERYFTERGLSPHRKHERKVFLASDEPKVLKEAPIRFPDFTFLMAPSNSTLCPEGLVDAILTVRLLAQTDYLVCTFSSNVCRAAYAFMQTVNREEDAGDRVTSIDSEFYFLGQQHQFAVATQDHLPRGSQDLTMAAGDRLELLDGGIALNLRTKLRGRFPADKVRLEYPAVAMPTYSVPYPSD